MIIRMEHIRAANLCSRGARAWFNRYSLDYNHFLKHGYPESTILGTNDALGKRVVAAAHAREESNG